MSFESYKMALATNRKDCPMSHIAPKSTPNPNSPQPLLALVHAGALKAEPSPSGHLGISASRLQVPWLEVVPKSKSLVSIGEEDLFAFQRATSRREQFWEGLIFSILAASGLAVIGVAFWVLTRLHL